jgi:hypothetical protein
LDPFEEAILTEKEAERHRQPANTKEDGEDLSSKQGGGKERHFSYYAYAGLTGQRRWSHKSEDFHRDPFTLPTIPQHNYKLDAASLNSRHTGEADCREYRESVLSVMPHRWVSGLLCTIVVACVVKKPMQDGIYVLHKSWLI